MPSRKKKLRLHRPATPLPHRRAFLAGGAACLAGGATLLTRLLGGQDALAADLVRPPTADPDDDAFQSRCVRCGLCGTVCENGCIRFFGLGEDAHGALTPYLDVRQRSCTLCMRCTNICPTGALTPTEKDLPALARTLRMGKARVDPDRCISYLGRLCGYCHDACPLPGVAIRLTPPALPVILDDCVGCGRCVEHCPAAPTAIFVERVPS
ncbi:MAG: 4Fe-4S dicluster domain-containing protein [bacterium]